MLKKKEKKVKRDNKQVPKIKMADKDGREQD